MTKEVVELNCGLSDLEIDHEEGTVSFICGDRAVDVISIEAILEAAEILKDK